MGDGGAAVSYSTGMIKVAKTDSGFDWEWSGGNVAWISRALLEDAAEGVFSTRTPAIGEVFTVGPFTVKCTEHLIYQNAIAVERIS